MVNINVFARVAEYTRSITETRKISHIAAGFSGGADSCAMLYCLCKLRRELGFGLSAVHVNHGLRGGESDGDMEFCRVFCEKYDVPFFPVHAKVESGAHVSVELSGRNARYAAFTAHAARYENCAVATAHNADDNVETVLLNMLRGTGLRGLCGIPPYADDRRGFIIRPMLSLTKDEILGFCADEGLEYVTDSSNDDVSYTRNKIRHSVMPVLREINPSVAETVTRQSKILSEFADYLYSVCDSQRTETEAADGCLDITKLRELPRPVGACIIKNYLENKGVNITFKLVERILSVVFDNNCIKEKFNVGKDTFVVIRGGVLSVEFEKQNYRGR